MASNNLYIYINKGNMLERLSITLSLSIRASRDKF